jgi:hypothetical protein
MNTISQCAHKQAHNGVKEHKDWASQQAKLGITQTQVGDYGCAKAGDQGAIHHIKNIEQQQKQQYARGFW